MAWHSGLPRRRQASLNNNTHYVKRPSLVSAAELFQASSKGPFYVRPYKAYTREDPPLAGGTLFSGAHTPPCLHDCDKD